VTHDLYADQPWAFSNFLATMHKVKVIRAMPDTFSACKSAEECFRADSWPDFPFLSEEEKFCSEDITPLFFQNDVQHSTPTLSSGFEDNEDTIRRLCNDPGASKNRVSWLSSKDNRKKLKITPNDVITADFANGLVRTLTH